MEIELRPLVGHPFTIRGCVDTRAPSELAGLPPAPQNGKGSENVLLMQPPVILVQDGGGEQLLNQHSVLEQIKLYKNENKNGFYMPKSLVVNIIKEPNMSGDMQKLLGFIFGPLQQLYHKKTISKGRPLWKAIIEQITEDEHLKNCIETTLFNGETLYQRHYAVLLRAANIGESSIGHAPGVPQQKRYKNKKHEEVRNSNSNTPGKVKEAKEVVRMQEKPSSINTELKSEKEEKTFNFEELLAVIKRAAERGEEQFASNMEISE